MPPVSDLMSPTKFQQMLVISEFLAKSDLIPLHFRAKPANVFVALEFSNRMSMSPFMVMQNLYVVHGRPGFEAKLSIALLNESGRYDQGLQYDIKRDAKGNIISCIAWTTKEGQRVEGPPVTVEMVSAEKWDQDKKNSQTGYIQVSKWKTMPEMMYRYRAATFFVRVNDPGVLMGLQTKEELEDVLDIEEVPMQLTGPQEQDSSVFDALFASKNPTEEQKALLGKFLKLYKDKNPEEIKAEAALAFEGEKGFWNVFITWCEKQKKAKVSDKPQDAPASTPAPQPQEEKQEGTAGGGEPQDRPVGDGEGGPTMEELIETLAGKDYPLAKLEAMYGCRRDKWGAAEYKRLTALVDEIG